MGLVWEYLTFAGKSSEDFNVHISGTGTYDAPERDVQKVSVPGRNGDLTIDNGRFKNIEITYPAFITKDFRRNYDAFKAFLMSQRGYKRLADSYHPEYYRMALYRNALKPDMTALNRAGSFEVTFDCDPRRFLKIGERTRELTRSEALLNPTLYEAKPLIRIYGTGTLTIGSNAVKVNSADVYTDIDCDLQEAFKGDLNCNANITLTSGRFPTLAAGNNNIYLSGVTKAEITPRWWTV